MKKSTAIRTTAAATIAAAGLAVGGVGLASAADENRLSSGASTTDGGDRHPRPGGPGMHDGAELAEALGVSESELEAAWDAVREDVQPSDHDRSTPPTDAERDEMRSQLVAALADELGLTDDEVAAALDEIHDDHEAERRTELSDRLDQAVAAGDLSAADKASVLEAYDAGVLGGPGRLR
jgi:hypothetical protein